MPSGKMKIFFKVISATVAGIFLWQQVSWAGDFIDYTLDKLNNEQAQTFAPAYLQNQQAIHESLISDKQAIEDGIVLQALTQNKLASESTDSSSDDVDIDLQGPRGGGSSGEQVVMMAAGAEPPAPEEGAILSVTTETGDVIHYKGDQIEQIDTKDSQGGKITIKRIEGLDFVDVDSNLLNAEITYADGTTQIVANGKVSRITKPDGIVFEYSDTVTAYDGTTFTHTTELITEATYPDVENPEGNVVEYFYSVDGDGNILETKLKDSEKSSFYDKNGTLIKVRFNNGKLIEYDNDKTDDSDNGILSKVVTEDGKIYIYEKTEETVGDETVYTVKLKEIRDTEGNIFRVEDNNIVEVELADGTKLRNFQLDATGHMINGQILYKDDPTIVSVLVESQKIKEINDINGNKTTYHYDEFNVAGDVIKATIDVEDSNHSITTYTYIRNEETNGVTITSGDKTWEYNGAWTLEKFNDSTGTIEHHYSPLAIFPPIYIGSTYTLTEGMVKEYDQNRNLIETTLADGTVYEYYNDGQFAGNIQRSISPDGKVSIYDYKITAEGDLAVYKRTSYNDATSYQSYYTNDPISYATNPTLKTSFNLDSAKTYTSAYASASYYQYNDKSVSLSLNFYNQKPYLYYYSYNYQTRQSTYDYKYLDININKGTDYTVEYVWTATGVNIYLYESSGTRPSTPVYTIADNKWNPRFSISGSNARLTLDPSSSGVYRKSASVSTDYNKPLKGNPIHTSEFTFDQNATTKYLYYSIYGNTDTTYDSIYLNYNNGTPSLTAYHYDYQTRQYANQTIPLNITFIAGTTYVIQTKVEDNILNLYIYEKGTTPQGSIYTMQGASWDARIYSSINGGSLNVDAYDNLEVYKYDSEDGDILGRNRYGDKDALTYIYDEAGEILQKQLVLGDGTTKIYDKFNKLLSEAKATGETTVYEYDEAGNVISITPQFPEGTAYVYYDSGAFQGKLKTATLPDGKIAYYDYAVNGSGNLQVYKRVSYDKNNIYQSAYSSNYIPSSTNPTLKASFNLDGTKTSSSVYASAYYYNYNDKSVSLYVNIYSSKPTLYYYYYDYKTRQTVRDNRELNITINRGATYNIEYVWTSTGVNVYIYDASQPRPATPIYTLANSNWNPRFSVSGSNAALVLDPSSSGTYTTSKNVSTDYNNPLKGSPIHTTTFSLNSAASYKSFYYSVYGSTPSTYDSIYFSYYNGTPTLRVYHYNYTTSQYTNSTIPLNITIRDNVTYVIQTKIENNTLKFYIYESGTTPTDPVYTIENATWDPQIYTNVNGGDMNVVACDRLETYEYNTTSGIMLDKDVEVLLRNKNIVIDDPVPTLPEYTLVSGAPLIFPDGKTDIINNLMPAVDFSATLPSDIFNPDGSVIESSDSADKAYFDVITYSQNNAIKNIVKLTGETIAYSNGLVDNILSGSSTTSYSYTLSDLNNISEITVDRDGIRRIYDNYGNLQSLSLDDATKIVYENDQVKEIQKADGTTIRKTMGTDDMFFRENGELNDALVSYPDGSMAIYNDGELLQLISASGDTTDYGDGKIRHVKLADGTEYDWDYIGDNIVITDNSRQEKRTYFEGRLLQLEELTGTKLITRYYYNDGTKNLIRSEITQNNEILYTYTYTYENDLTLVHDEDGNTQAYTNDKKLSYIIDSQGRKYSYTYVGKNEGYIEVYFPSGVKVRYDSDGKIIDITEADGAIVKDITLDANNNPKDFTYIKGGDTYKITNGVISEVLSNDDTDTLYYENGFVKSIQTEIGNLTEYQYFVKDNKTFSNISTLLSGNLNQLSFYNSGTTTYLELSENSLQFGTGVDGVKHVTTNETLAAGTYNFTTLIIDAGKTITVASGATINALESIIINGTLSAPDVSINGYMITIGETGSVTGAGQRLNANTINIAPGASTLSAIGSANQGSTTHTYNGSPGAYTASDVRMFSSRHIDRVDWSFRIKLDYDRGGTDSIGTVYLCINGNWQEVYSTGHLGFTRDNTFTSSSSTGWDNVTGVRLDTWTGTAGPSSQSWSWNYYATAYGNPEMNYINKTGNVPPSTHQVIYPSSGTFESEVIELDALELGSMSWSQELPIGTNVTFQTRTGATATPDDTWSEWSEPLTNPASLEISSPISKKYFQYKINLSSSNSAVTPKVILDPTHSISISYTKFSENPLDSYVKVKENNVTSAYNNSGILIWTEDITGARTYYDPANPQGTIDLASLKFDVAYMDGLIDDLPSYKLSDAQKVITIYDKGNDLPVEIVMAGQSITYFDQGFATKIVDKNGIVQVVYTYDENKNVIKVEFVDARQKLEENYQKAVTEITTEREASLAKIAQAEVDARADITAKSADIQKQIDDERTRLTQEKSKYDPNIYDLSEFDRVFGELDDYETKLHQQTQDAYTDLDVQVTAARARIEADASTAMQSLIDNDYNKILADIVQKESSPSIYQYYRKVLGRDPGDDDLLYWTNIAKTELRPITATELTQYLENLPEYSDRATRKQNIIANITGFFTQYFSASESEKETMLTSLGFTSEEVSAIIQSNLSQADINTILSWLTGQSLHFGDSAFETIISMLESSGVNKSFKDIAKDAIKVDILTGVITKDTTGDLLISMFAMRKAAEANGLVLYSQKISYDDLKDQISRNNVIVHIDGKHYVLVTSINDTEGTITYIDSTVGQNGQEMTLSRAEFMGKWKGYSLSKELPADPTKQLNVTQEKNIRGSGWWEDFWRGIVNFFQKIIAPVAAILLMIPPLAPIGAIMLGINIIIQTISFVVRTGTLMDVVWSVVNTIGSAIGATILPGIYEAAGQVFSSIGQAIFAPLKGVFSAVMPIFNNLSTAVSNIATGIGHIVSFGTISAEIAADIGYNIIAKGVSLGTDMLFKNLNIDPSLARIGSAILTGAIMGAVSPNGNIETNIVAEALTRGTIAGVEEIGKAADLDPNITYLSAMMAGYVVGGALDIDGRHLTYDELMASITVRMLEEASFIGINELGNIFGLDPRISYLLGVGLGTSLGTGYMRDPITGNWRFDVDRMWRGAIDGLTNPKTLSIAFSVAGDAIGLDPIYNNIIINLTMGAIEGGLENPRDIISGIFKGMLDNFIQTSIRALTLDLYDPITGGWNKGWQAEYAATHLINFIEIVQRDGIVPALEHYISTIFRDDAIRSINEIGGIADFLTERAEIVYEDNIAKKKINFTDDYKLYLNPDTDEVIGRDYGTTKERGAYGVNPFTNGFGLINGTIREETENGTIVYHVKDSIIIEKMELFMGGRHFSIISRNPEIGLELDASGMPIGGIVEDFEGIQLFEYEYIDNSMLMKLNIQNPNLPNSNLSINLSNISDAEKQEILNYYMLANGINNMNPYGSPGYMDGFAIDLAHADPGAEDFTFIPLFNEFYGKISPATFEKIYQNPLYAIAIYEDLKSHGYVDQEGKILPSFLEVKNPSDFIMSSQFSAIKNDIYQILWSSCQHAAEDVVKWLQDVHGDSHEITNKIISDIQAKFAGNYPVDMVGFGYSGAGDPFIQAINQQVFNGQYLDVDSIVLVGTPLKKDIIGVGLWDNRTIVNPNVKTVITIEGEKDIFHPTDHSFDSSLFVQNEFKIIIKDAGHTDYFYDPNRPSPNDAFKMKVSRFIAEVTARSKDSEQLRDFLRLKGILIVNGKYIVDVSEVTYD